MRPRILLTVALSCLVYIPSAFGQLPKRVEKCLPYPTLAQEIREIQPLAPQVRIRVVRIEFDSKDGIPTDAREDISTQLANRVFELNANTAYLEDLAKEIAEVSVRGTLLNKGYFTVIATAKLMALESAGSDINVAVAISTTPGIQYRVGGIRIESADSGLPLSISPAVLRPLMPLQKGDLFNVEKIRMGLQNITRAYLREGYVNMTAEPDFEIDEAHETIDMVLKIDQELQYRVGSIEFLGIGAAKQEKLMESLSKPGEVFDGTRVQEFFRVNRAILPSDASPTDDVKIGHDPKTRTVVILFDFRACPNSN
jgi:outer membrane protein assembly factor BamA